MKIYWGRIIVYGGWVANDCSFWTLQLKMKQIYFAHFL